jgi:hypothetical protein
MVVVVVVVMVVVVVVMVVVVVVVAWWWAAAVVLVLEVVVGGVCTTDCAELSRAHPFAVRLACKQIDQAMGDVYDTIDIIAWMCIA